MRLATLCFLIKNNQILLAIKKRGFGQGRWNGVGGKQHPNETIIETAIRETQEEIGVILKKFEQKTTLSFYFQNNPDWNQKVTVFIATEWEGEPIESDEMKPQWFDFNKIPYSSMWSDDPLWLPLLLKKKNFVAEFLFDKNDQFIDHSIKKKSNNKPNISKKELTSKKSLIKLLSKTNSQLIPSKLKDFISEYEEFLPHLDKYSLWSTPKKFVQISQHHSKYDKVVILLNGVAAGGKDAIREEIERIIPGLMHTTITGTSRKPRPNETHGKDYYFFDNHESFKIAIKAGEFIEWVEQGNGYYGLPKKSLEEGIKHSSPIVFSKVEMSAWEKVEEHLNTITDTKIFVLKLFVLPHMSFFEYKNWLSQKRDDDINSRLIRTCWEISEAPKKADFIITNRIRESKNPLTYTAQSIVNLALKFLSSSKFKEFPLPFMINNNIKEIEDILKFHDSIE